LIDSSVYNVIPSLDGSLFLYTPNGMTKHAMTVPEIVSASPFSQEDGTLLMGSKHTSIWSFDPHSGSVHRCYATIGEGSCEEEEGEDAVIVARVDYVIKAIDVVSRQERWNVTLGSFLSQTDLLLPLPPQMKVKEDEGGVLVSSIYGDLSLVKGENVVWTRELEAPASYARAPAWGEGAFPLLFRGGHQDGRVMDLEESAHVLVGEFEGKLFAVNAPDGDDLGVASLFPPPVLRDRRISEDRVSIYMQPICSDVTPDCMIGLHPLAPVTLPGGQGAIGPGDDNVSVWNEYFPQTFLARVWIGVGASLFLVPLSLLFYTSWRGEKKRRERKKKLASKAAKRNGKKNDKGKKMKEKVKKEKKQDQQDGRVGNLQVSDQVLGYGSSGTVVFKGHFRGREVAVKRMLKTFVQTAEREVKLLIESDLHPNLVHYYTMEEDKEFVYLALTYCRESLEEFMSSSRFPDTNKETREKMVLGICRGMNHLHNLNIVHRDLKPQNILLDWNGGIKISDMGLAKKLDSDANSFSTNSPGSRGWQAPELLTENGGKRRTKKVDIFAFGCLAHYILTGKHPFGERLEREINIVQGTPQIKVIGVPEKIVRACTHLSPSQRPPAGEILAHPFFWSPQKRLQFLKDASDMLEFEDEESALVKEWEKGASQVIPRDVNGEMDWISLLHHELQKDLSRWRSYKGYRLRDLIRVIRNKAHHFRDLSPGLQKALGPFPEGYYTYFAHLYPGLFWYAYEFVKRERRGESVFRTYFNAPV